MDISGQQNTHARYTGGSSAQPTATHLAMRRRSSFLKALVIAEIILANSCGPDRPRGKFRASARRANSHLALYSPVRPERGFLRTSTASLICAGVATQVSIASLDLSSEPTAGPRISRKEFRCSSLLACRRRSSSCNISVNGAKGTLASKQARNLELAREGRNMLEQPRGTAHAAQRLALCPSHIGRSTEIKLLARAPTNGTLKTPACVHIRLSNPGSRDIVSPGVGLWTACDPTPLTLPWISCRLLQS